MSLEMDIHQIHALKREAMGYWTALHSAMEADYRELDNGPEVSLVVDGEAQTAINPHTAAVKVRSAVNHLIDGDLDIKVDTNARSEAGKRRGEEISGALKAIHYQLTSSAVTDPHYGALFMAAGLGMGVWYVGAAFDRLEMTEKRKPVREKGEADRDFTDRMDSWRDERDRAFPVILEHEDPRVIYPDPGTHGEKWVMKVERRSVGDIRRSWPGWRPRETGGFLGFGKRAKADFEEVEWFELWSAPGGLGADDPGSYYYEADGIPIRRFGSPDEEGEAAEYGAGPWPNPWGFLPYVIWSAGYGMPKGKPEQVFKGLIRDAREGNLFRAKAEKATQIHSISRAAAWFGWAVPQGYGDRFSTGVGAINELPTDPTTGRITMPQPLVGPAPPAVLFSEQARLDAEIDAETISSVLSTPGADGSDVALLYARKVQEASTAIGPVKENAQRAYNQVWQRIALLLSNPTLFGEDESFNVVGVKRSTDEAYVAKVGRRLFEGQHIYHTKIDPRFPEDQAGKISSGLAQLRSGAIDLETHLERYAGSPNPALDAAKAGAYQVFQRVLSGDTKSPLAAFFVSYMSGQLPKDIKASDFLRARASAEVAATKQMEAGGGAPDPSGRQIPNSTGGPMMAGGGGGMSPDMGASQAFSEQSPSNGQRWAEG